MALNERRICINSLNPYITCQLCKGYFIDATTVNECLHTFCKSCLLKHLNEFNTCPTCLIVIHQRHPLNYISFDRTMQDIVYRLVPNLLQNERERERNFYREKGMPYPSDISPTHSNVKEKAINSDHLDLNCNGLKGFSEHISIDPTSILRDPFSPKERQYFQTSCSSEDIFCLSIEYQPPNIFGKPHAKRRALSLEGHPASYPSDIPYQRRYLRCKGGLRIQQIKKWLRLKYNIKSSIRIDVLFKEIPLLDESSIMDLAYISELEKKPLNLYYRISNI